MRLSPIEFCGCWAAIGTHRRPAWLWRTYREPDRPSYLLEVVCDDPWAGACYHWHDRIAEVEIAQSRDHAQLLTERVLRAITEFDRSLFAVRFGVGR